MSLNGGVCEVIEDTAVVPIY